MVRARELVTKGTDGTVTRPLENQNASPVDFRLLGIYASLGEKLN